MDLAFNKTWGSKSFVEMPKNKWCNDVNITTSQTKILQTTPLKCLFKGYKGPQKKTSTNKKKRILEPQTRWQRVQLIPRSFQIRAWVVQGEAVAKEQPPVTLRNFQKNTSLTPKNRKQSGLVGCPVCCFLTESSSIGTNKQKCRKGWILLFYCSFSSLDSVTLSVSLP